MPKALPLPADVTKLTDRELLATVATQETTDEMKRRGFSYEYMKDLCIAEPFPPFQNKTITNPLPDATNATEAA